MYWAETMSAIIPYTGNSINLGICSACCITIDDKDRIQGFGQFLMRVCILYRDVHNAHSHKEFPKVGKGYQYMYFNNNMALVEFLVGRAVVIACSTGLDMSHLTDM